MQPNDEPVVQITSSLFRTRFTKDWRQAMERDVPLVITHNKFPEMILFPLTKYVPLVHVPLIAAKAAEVQNAVFSTATPANYKTNPPLTSPELLRRALGEERRRFQGLGVPVLITYYDKLVGVLFLNPYYGTWLQVEQLIVAWRKADVLAGLKFQPGVTDEPR
jgi:hypothetical protein